MISLGLLAAIVIAITWILAYLIIPTQAAYELVWCSVGIFTLAVILLFIGLTGLAGKIKDGNGKNPSLIYPLSGYVIFCFLAIFVSLLFSGYLALSILHLFGILLACIVGFTMSSAWKKSATFAAEHREDKKIAFNRAETLNEIYKSLKIRQTPALSTAISKVHLFSEKLRYAAGSVDAETDIELDALIRELETMTEQNISNEELHKQLPVLLQKIENKLAKRERLALL